MAAARFAVLFGLGVVEEVAGHGWITSPAPRQSSTCQHCLNGPQICGASDATDAYKGPVVTWKEGSIIEVTVEVTAHHKGHYEFSICDQVITSSFANAQECLDKHILERASAAEAGISDCQPGDKRAACQPLDPRHTERFYLPPPGFSPTGGNVHTFFMKLPAGLKCEACTMQWRWWSANSCIPAPDYPCFMDVLQSNGYTDAASWGLTNWAAKTCPGGGCNRCACGEEFRNCVDISIEASGAIGPAPTPTPSPTTEPSTTSPATMPSTTSAATTTSTTMAQPGCRAVPVAGNTLGATDAKCDATCAVLPAGMWPCSSTGPCSCDGSAATPPPTPQATPAPTPAPTPSTGSSQCGSCQGCLWTAHNACYSWDKATCDRYDGYEWCA